MVCEASENPPLFFDLVCVLNGHISKFCGICKLMIPFEAIKNLSKWANRSEVQQKLLSGAFLSNDA